MRAEPSIREMSTPDECTALATVLAKVWGFRDIAGVGSPDLLRALTFSGGYVAGTFADGELVGGGFGWPTQVGSEWRLHSHVVGFIDGYRGRGLGALTKFQQRAWAADRGLAAVEWTYDPLHAANAQFNLNKLGARVQSFYPDFYGPMTDVFSAGVPSDRFVLRWGIDDSPSPVEGDAEAVRDGRRLLVQIPADIVAIRRLGDGAAAEWHAAFAAVVAPALSNGWRVRGITASNEYVLDAGGD